MPNAERNHRLAARHSVPCPACAGPESVRRHLRADRGVRLVGSQVAQQHFEVRWRAAATRHDVCDYGTRCPLVVNGMPLRGDCRALAPGDCISLGRYTVEYVALADRFR
jgi:hypothetical protein